MIRHSASPSLRAVSLLTVYSLCVFPSPIVLTRTTNSPLPIFPLVREIVAPATFRFPRVGCRDPIASGDVHRKRHWLNVVPSDAISHSTQMIRRKPVRYLRFKSLVPKDVGHDHFVPVPKSPIPALHCSPEPKPAWSEFRTMRIYGSPLIYLGPKPILSRYHCPQGRPQ